MKQRQKGSGAVRCTPPAVCFTRCQLIWCSSHYSFTSGQEPLPTPSLLWMDPEIEQVGKKSQPSRTLPTLPSFRAPPHARRSALKERIRIILLPVSIVASACTEARRIFTFKDHSEKKKGSWNCNRFVLFMSWHSLSQVSKSESELIWTFISTVWDCWALHHLLNNSIQKWGNSESSPETFLAEDAGDEQHSCVATNFKSLNIIWGFGKLERCLLFWLLTGDFSNSLYAKQSSGSL